MRGAIPVLGRCERAAIPDSEIFNLRPYHTASEALFCCGYRNVGQEKAREGMQQEHGKKKIKDFQGGHCTDTSSHGDFATRESISKSKKGEEVDGGDDGFFGVRQIRMMTLIRMST